MRKIISDQQIELAKWALEFIQKKGNADGSITIYSSVENLFEYRNSQLDILQQSAQNSMLIQLYINGRFASYTTNCLKKKELERFITQGIETTRYLEKDEFRKLPETDRLYQRGKEDLDIYDEAIKTFSLDEKLDLIRENVQEVYCLRDKRLISISAEYTDGIYEEYKVSSNCFEGKASSTYFSLVTETSLKDKRGARPSAYWCHSALFWKDLQKKGNGIIAYEKNIRKLGQKKIPSGQYKMLVDNLSAGRLLTPLVTALSGSAIQQKSSFLINKLHSQIVSDKITITDNPHIHRAFGARWFDAEGVATRDWTVIQDGVLNIYYIDTYYAGKLAMSPTIQSPSILTFKHGNEDFEQILSSMEKGIWVTEFNGGNSNPTTGDFSFGIEGFLVENGKTVQPLHEMNITGNLLTLWENVEKIGNDPRLDTQLRIPSILFNCVSFSGG